MTGHVLARAATGRAVALRDGALIAADVVIVVAGYGAGLGIRLLDGRIGDGTPLWSGLLGMLPLIVAAHVLANYLFGSYGRVWRLASVAEARSVATATFAASSTLFLGVALWRSLSGGLGPIPLSSIVMGGSLSLAGMGAVRFQDRLRSERRPLREVSTRVLVVGVSRVASALASELPGIVAGARVVGIVDPSGRDEARHAAGFPVLGPIGDIESLIEEHKIDMVVVVGDGTGELVRRVVDATLAVDVTVRVMPDVAQAVNRRASLLDSIGVPMKDLIPRPGRAHDLSLSADVLEGSTVLITGAGGSIGSEILTQVLKLKPARVVALDEDETLLHEVVKGWTSADRVVVPVLCNIRDARAVMRVFAETRPDVVLHAAALKHVPILEQFPGEAFATNVLGTRNVIRASSAYRVTRFSLVSTDKAVEPVNVMGATKRIAEMLTQTANIRADGCIYTVVRFGNVLASRGSVLPIFVRQIASGGPVTVTDPEMTRYFMTAEEAAQLVLQAVAMGTGGEVFVLDMGEPVSIGYLSRRLIRMAGLVPGRDIELTVVGARPGERLTESLAVEPLQPTAHPGINMVRPPTPGPVALNNAVDALSRLADAHDTEGLRAGLYNLVRQEWTGDEVVDLRVIEGALGQAGADDILVENVPASVALNRAGEGTHGR